MDVQISPQEILAAVQEINPAVLAHAVDRAHNKKLQETVNSLSSVVTTLTAEEADDAEPEEPEELPTGTHPDKTKPRNA